MKTLRHREVRPLGRNHIAEQWQSQEKGWGVLSTTLMTLLCKIHLNEGTSTPVSGDRDITTNVCWVNNDKHFPASNPKPTVTLGCR